MRGGRPTSPCRNRSSPKAKALKINIPAAGAAGLAGQVKARRAKQWLELLFTGF